MKSFKSYLTEAADYSVDVIHHHVDDAGQKTKKTYTYNVKNALTAKHAKRIAMQKHENAVKLGKGESYSTSSSNVRMQEDVMTEAQTSKTGIVETEVYGTKAYHAKCMEPGCKFESKRYDRIKQAQDAAQKHAKEHFGKNVKEEVELDERCWPGYKETPGKKAYEKGSCTKEEVEQIDELSNEMLGRYKKAAGASASAADKAGDFAKGNKRFSGIVKATKKQFANDMKKEDVQIDEGEGVVTPKKTLHGEPPKGTYAYERKYGAYTAKGELRKKPNPNKPPVKEDVELEEDWQKVNKSDRTDGLSQKAVDAYRRENPGSKLQTAVTEKNPKGKRAARRKSFCSRMSGMKKRLTNPENARDPDSPINKALRRWNC
jgi:hypothetical protein